MPDLETWLADDGAVLRAWLADQTPDWLDGVIAGLPLWAASVLGFFAALASVWVVIQIVQGRACLPAVRLGTDDMAFHDCARDLRAGDLGWPERGRQAEGRC